MFYAFLQCLEILRAKSGSYVIIEIHSTNNYYVLDTVLNVGDAKMKTKIFPALRKLCFSVKIVKSKHRYFKMCFL